ncbi:MAG: tRNA (uridine(34)/cytosine(34)/5-carboxymethylaminomethyluridine(34)-2'-O)-methyltransferase TrmL [Arenimonas sp.]
MLNVILFQPEIPPNTGNIIRLCANTGAKLHLIEPLGFELDDAKLRRAGLDYHEFAEVRVHSDIEACFSQINRDRVFAFSRHASNAFSEVCFQDGDAFLFGRETKGLPAEVLALLPLDRKLRLPMVANQRSLNLSNAVAVTVYEAWRQLGYAGSSSL